MRYVTDFFQNHIFIFKRKGITPVFDNLFVGYYISRQFWQQEVTPLRTADCYELERRRRV